MYMYYKPSMFGSRLNDRSTICGGMCGSSYRHVALVGEIAHSGFGVTHSFEFRAQALFDFEIARTTFENLFQLFHYL